ncbi:MAG: hypothetical protein AAGI51_13730, partial [Pseudomonadota bacterium]
MEPETLLGTNGPDVLESDELFTEKREIAFGLGGDDQIETGRGQDTIFGGPGNDRVQGGTQIDYYHYVLSSQNLVIDEFENSGVLPQNNADRLRFYIDDDEAFAEHTEPEVLGLEQITDAFLVTPDEDDTEPDLFDGANDRDGNSYNAFFYTARGGLQIIDQYGDNSGGGGQGDDR